MNAPDPAPPEQSPPLIPSTEKGSLLVGFLLGWAAMIAGLVINGLFWSLQSSLGLPGTNIVFMGVGTLPIVAMIALAIWFASRGKSRAVRGVLLAFASMIGLVLLLVAACFGLIAVNGGLGNMH